MPEHHGQSIAAAVFGLLLVVLMLASCTPLWAAEIWFCDDGQGACEGMYLDEGMYVPYCPGASFTPPAACSLNDGEPAWWKVKSLIHLEGTDYVIGGGGTGVLFSSLGLHSVIESIGSGGELPAQFEIDFEALAEPFSIGFLLLASCWALGKGVAVVVSLVKS